MHAPCTTATTGFVQRATAVNARCIASHVRRKRRAWRAASVCASRCSSSPALLEVEAGGEEARRPAGEEDASDVRVGVELLKDLSALPPEDVVSWR